jgi:hypothetical protein
LVTGTKTAKGVMWAGAKLTGLEVTGYKPDARALEVLDEMRQGLEANK